MNEKHSHDAIRLDVISKVFHVLGLLQHEDDCRWNKRTLADVITSTCNDSSDVSEKMIAGYIEKLKDMGYPVVSEKGVPRIWLSRDLCNDEILKTLNIYIGLVADTFSVQDCFQSYVKENGRLSLWMITSIYFATVKKEIISIDYKSEKSDSYKTYRIHPYRWVMRENALYLFAGNEKAELRLFRINRMKNLKTSLGYFDEPVPDVNKLLHSSLGAFVGSDVYSFILRFPKRLKDRVNEDFGRLNINFVGPDENGIMRATFSASDILSICRAIFPIGNDVIIEAPEIAVSEMKRLLQENMRNYDFG